MRSSIYVVTASLCCIDPFGGSVWAAIDVSSIGSVYNQDFNSLASSVGPIDWTNDSDPTLPGWSLYRVTSNTNSTPFPIVRYEVSNGSADSGRFYSFGTDSDRALGGIGSGFFGDGPGTSQTNVNNSAIAGWIAVSFHNDTSTTYDQITVGYDGEQWRDAGNVPSVPQTMVFEYGYGNTFASVGTWIQPGVDFNFAAPEFSETAGMIDGNSDGLDADLGGPIPNQNWTPGQTLWLRWIERNDNVLDHGLAIDNFSFSVTVVPEPGAFLLGCAACGVAALLALFNRLVTRSARPV
jgi:hypothetical protein